MVLASHPFLPKIVHLIFCCMRHFYAMGTCLSLQITFFGWTFGIAIHFYRRTFCVYLHFYGRTFELKKEQTRRKHEKKTKKTRKIHAILRIFRPNRGQIIGRKQPVDLWKDQWAKLDHWNQRVKMTRWNQRLKKSLWCGWKPTTPLRAKMARSYKLYRRLRRGGTQKCHLVIFSKNLLTKSDLCVILL